MVPPIGRGLCYGPLGTQLEGGSSFLMGKLRLLLFCPTNKLNLTITIYPNFLEINHRTVSVFLPQYKEYSKLLHFPSTLVLKIR